MLVSASILRIALMRFALLVLAVAAVATCLAAARPPQVERPRVSVSSWIDPSGQATIDSVRQSRPDPFRPAAAGQYAGVVHGQALWLRVKVHVPATGRWYVGYPDTRAESVTLWSAEGGAWQPQVAGERIPVQDWPVPSASPLFPVDFATPDATLWMRIEASNDTSVLPAMHTVAQVGASQQQFTLVQGLYLGLIGMVVLFAWSCAFVYRDRAYLWLGAHALIVCLIVARVVGIAGLHLWPDAPHWNDVSEHVLSILCMAPLLGFIAVSVSLRGRSPAAYWVVCALAVLCAAAAAGAMAMPMPLRVQFASVVVVGLAATCLGLVAWAWWRGDRFARWILLAFAPMLAALPQPIGRWLLWLPQDFFTEHAMQIGLGLTLPGILLLLVLRSQERSDYGRRISRIDQVDPLTGLVNDEVFAKRLRGLAHRSRRLGHHSALILIDIANHTALEQEFGHKRGLELLLRIARRLTNMVRPMDTVARVGERRFGVLMEGPVPPERSTQLASKFVARLILPFGGLPQGLLPQPRIAVVLVPIHAGEPVEALRRAEALLEEAGPGDRRAIFVADIDTTPVPLSSAPA